MLITSMNYYYEDVRATLQAHAMKITKDQLTHGYKYEYKVPGNVLVLRLAPHFLALHTVFVVYCSTQYAEYMHSHA